MLIISKQYDSPKLNFALNSFSPQNINRSVNNEYSTFPHDNKPIVDTSF